MLTAVGLLAAVLGLAVGAVMGGLGGGGGVLTVPALVYVLDQSAQDATTSSVVIVGVTALAGALTRVRAHAVDWRTGIAFGVVGVPVAYLGTALNRAVGQPVLLLAFAALTVLAAGAMLFDDRGSDSAFDGSGHQTTAASMRPSARHVIGVVVKTALCGAAVGFLTGFLGVGGGFLVLPALVIALRMPMGLAVGTSLLIIVLNAGASVAARAPDLHLDWRVVIPFTVAAVLGTTLGKKVADRLSGATLTRAFAAMLVAVGLFVGIESIVAM